MIYNVNDILDILSESTMDDIFDLYDLDLFIEDGDNKEPKENKFKKAVTKMGTAYVSGINKSSEAGARAVVRKPKEGSSPEALKKYEEQLLKAKTAIKIGEILVSKAFLIGPLDTIATAALITGMANSDDPTDKIVMDKLKMLANKAEMLKKKVSNLFDKNKDKPVTGDDKRQYDAILLQGKNIAKKIDDTKAENNTATPVTESVLINKFNEYLLKEDGNLVDNAYEILSTIVEKTDYAKYDIFPVVEHYIDMIA
jgi:hypothetical protein